MSPSRQISQYLSKSARLLNRTHIRKRQLKAALHEHSAQMKPGFYTIGFRLAHHLGSPLPTSLATTKTTNRLCPDLFPIASRLMTPFDQLLPPNITYIPRRPSHEAAPNTTLFFSRLNGIKLFAPERNAVTTYFNSIGALEQIETAYLALSPYLPIPRLKIDPETLSIEEPLIHGTSFSKAAPHLQLKGYREIFLGLIELLMNSEQTTLTEVEVQSLFQRVLQRTDLPSTLRDRLINSKQRLIQLISNSPVVGSHNDLIDRNILISGDVIYVLDIEGFGEAPFFFDLLRLPITEAYRQRPLLLELFLEDDYQDLWIRALSAISAPNNFDFPDYLLAYLVFSIAEHSPAPGYPHQLWKPIYERWFADHI